MWFCILKKYSSYWFCSLYLHKVSSSRRCYYMLCVDPMVFQKTLFLFACLPPGFWRRPDRWPCHALVAANQSLPTKRGRMWSWIMLSPKNIEATGFIEMFCFWKCLRGVFCPSSILAWIPGGLASASGAFVKFCASRNIICMDWWTGSVACLWNLNLIQFAKLQVDMKLSQSICFKERQEEFALNI